MKNYFSIQLPNLPELKSKQMLALAEINRSDSSTQAYKLPPGISVKPRVSLRTIDDIIYDIQNRKYGNIDLLEWVYCIYNKNKWDALHPEKSMHTSKLIWEAAASNNWLKQHLFWQIALYYINGEDKGIAFSLAATLFDVIPSNPDDRAIVEILKYFSEPDYTSELARLCYSRLQTPTQFFKSYKLPHNNRVSDEILEQIAEYLPTSHIATSEQLNWMLLCLQQMSKKHELSMVERLLKEVTINVGTMCPDLVNWMWRKYGSSVPNSRWGELSSKAKEALRDWVGAAHYGDFQKLVDIILKSLKPRDKHRNQLERRKGFWSNYSDRFQRIRIFLPQSSIRVLGNNLQYQDIGTIAQDGSQPTEVCIFDFGDWFVAEFFRGSRSETRILSKNPELEERLFNSSEISLKYLRGLESEIHDHEFCWQYYCEQWLRKRNIFPNEGTKYFRGLSAKHNRYCHTTGLPKPSSEDEHKRQQKLLKWRQKWEC